MKTTDLMVGDWVKPSCWNEQVLLIGEGRVTVKSDSYPENEIKPIPLTAEILEKNGFKEYNGYGYASNKGYVFKEFYINNDFTIKTANINCKINFVHELQHALRLCGIDKEIKL